MKKTTAVIIGAQSAIAQAMAVRWQSHYRLVTLSRQAEPPASLRQIADLCHEKTDYSETSLLEIAQDHCQGQDVARIFCAVGILHDDTVFPEKKLSQLDAAALQHYFQVNTIIPALVLRAFVPVLDRQQAGVMAFLSAQIGSIGDNRLGGWYGYRASKAALNMLIKTASIEMARTHKHYAVVALHPGTTDSPLSEPFQPRIASERLYTPALTAERLDTVITQLQPEQSGQLLHWNGDVLPW